MDKKHDFIQSEDLTCANCGGDRNSKYHYTYEDYHPDYKDLTPLIQAWREYKRFVEVRVKNTPEPYIPALASFLDFMNWLETQTKPMDSTKGAAKLLGEE